MTPQPRDETKLPRLVEVPEPELETPDLRTVAKLVYNTVARLFHDPAGMIIGATFFLIMVWGQHGGLQLLGEAWSGWRGPGSDPAARDEVIPGVPWDQEWLSYWAGFLLVVVLPCLLIIAVFKQRLSGYGLGLPPRGRRNFALVSSLALVVLSVPTFLFAAGDDDMRSVYPLFRGAFDSDLDFVIYELGYIPFFIAIEFIFRGFLLFGLFQFRDRNAPAGTTGLQGPLLFGYYAIFLSMLSYTAWHLGKPQLELWGTIPWGLATGTIALVSRSIWPLVLVHWGLNAFLDFAIREGWSI